MRSARRIPSSDITDLPWPTNDCSRVCHFVDKIVSIPSFHAKGFGANRVRPARKHENSKEEKRCILEKRKKEKKNAKVERGTGEMVKRNE